jgi:hypothetical protein
MINSDEVHKTFMDCLFKDGEPTDKHVAVDGLTIKVGLHPERLESKREFVQNCIIELPEDFTTGGGQSFLNLCQDKHGEQWTSFHRVMEEFVIMSIGLKLADYCLPKDMWGSLPGGVPYVSFKT